jgi:squalene-hopene/tetraprenyl-beta-curcumene cyclase
MRRQLGWSLFAIVVAVAFNLPVMAQSSAGSASAAKLVDAGASYLQSAQGEDGSWSPQAGPGVTALAATGLLKNGRTVDDPVVAKALKYVEKHIHPDGGIYREGSTHKNYETCIAMMCFEAANADKRYDDILKKAEAFVKKEQWDAEEGHDESSMYYGGAGYGGHSRPDLSNTTFLLDALQAVGTDENDEAIQRALVFVSRCQNLETEHNQTKFAPLVNDGGFYYTIAAGGSSQAGANPDGGLRSYGSMTYAGLKSMIFAGVDRDDQRVKAALEWISKHYTLTENPGMADAGLYYYFHTFAKSLDAIGEDELEDDKGDKHNWRQELVDALAARQQPNGSWVNKNERWLEADPNLVTGYALLALSYCK